MLVKPRKTDNDVYRCVHCRLIFSPALQQEVTEPPGRNRP